MDDNYGSCCVCGNLQDVNNIFQLSYKVGSESESAWGCFGCGLPIEGAVAVVCDACIEKHGLDNIDGHIKFLMDGREGRIPVPPVEKRVPHEHDLSLHPEVWAETN